jgi:hypothetical protein
LTLNKIRKALPLGIAPKRNIQFKAVHCSLRLLGIAYAFLANEKTELCSWRNSHDCVHRGSRTTASASEVLD